MDTPTPSIGDLLPTPPPLLIVLSGPSGAGKDAVINELRAMGRPFYFAVTATTRPPRPGEVDGQDYYFLSDEQFTMLLENDGLLEHAEVYGRRYGVPRAPIRAALLAGEDVVMRVDVQGVDNLKRVVPDAVYVMIAPPSLEVLRTRLVHRGTESPEQLDLRLAKARAELEKTPEYDYVIVNHEGELDIAVVQLDSIVVAEKCRAVPRTLLI